jgi:hypothetical protein
MGKTIPTHLGHMALPQRRQLVAFVTSQIINMTTTIIIIMIENKKK